MKNNLLTAGLLLFSLASFGQDAKEIASKTLNATVAIFIQDNSNQLKSLGSGVIIDDNLIVTNFHVVDGSYNGYIKLNNSDNQLKIEGFVNIDSKNDLALIKVSGVTSKGIQINKSMVAIGESVYASGNPQGLTGTFSNGIVSAIRTLEGKELIQITAPISPGSSGGPVVNARGELIGIAVGAYTNGQNLNFAIPSKYVETLLSTKKELQALKTLFKAGNVGVVKSSIKVQGIELRNIIWGEDEYARDFNYQQLLEFSIKNNTENTIGKVRLLLLVYDKTKTMIDFADAIFVRDLNHFDMEIPPNMAKVFDATSSITANSAFGPAFRKRIGYFYELRILDYEIVN